MRRINIGLLGCGTVGRGFVELLGRERERIRGREGIDLQIRKILVRDESKSRPNIHPSLFTTSAVDVLDDGCDVIVELVGGVHCAGAYVRRAIDNGRNVVTANKALLAECGHELFDAAARQQVRIGFEASVCGAIPIVRALTRGLAGDRVREISGILNGTCNYILTRMEQDDLDFDAARRVAGGVELRVERRELPEFHPLAAVRDENNAVMVRSRAAGEMFFVGKGAGAMPTAAAVLSDVIEIARA